jgi:hypothetical protein
VPGHNFSDVAKMGRQNNILMWEFLPHYFLWFFELLFGVFDLNNYLGFSITNKHFILLYFICAPVFGPLPK